MIIIPKEIKLIKGYLFAEEENEIAKNAHSKQNGTIVEIGSYLGKSTAIIASNLSSGKLYAIDTWMNDAMSEGNKDTFEQFSKNIEPWKTKINPIRMTSHDASKNWNLKIDMLFIDGDHSYDGVKTDLKDWFKHIQIGGILLMHDYTFKEGVQKAVNELLQNTKTFQTATTIRSLICMIKQEELNF